MGKVPPSGETKWSRAGAGERPVSEWNGQPTEIQGDLWGRCKR